MKSKEITYECLCEDHLIYIFHYLILQDLIAVSLVNETFSQAALSDRVWKERFIRHFSHRLKRFPSDTSSIPSWSWHWQFQQTYEEEYSSLSSRERKLFSLVKEGSFEENDKKIGGYFLTDFEAKDNSEISLANWAAKKNYPPMLDSLFIAHLHSGDDKTQLELAVLYCRSLTEIKLLLNIALAQCYNLHTTLIKASEFAINQGQLDITKCLLDLTFLLISLDNKPDLFSHFMSTASRHGHVLIVNYLLEYASKKLKYNAQKLASLANFDYTYEGNTYPSPLYYATYFGHSEIVNILIKFQTDIQLPIHCAVHSGDLKILQVFIEHDPTLVNKPDILGQPPLLLAASLGYLDIVGYLLKHNPDIEAKTQGVTGKFSFQNGRTALCWAATNGHAQVVDLLLSNKANVRAATETGVQPIHLAAKNGRLAVVKKLIEFDPSLVNEVDRDKKTALHLAIENGYLGEIARILLDSNPNLENQLDNTGHPPGYYAIFFERNSDTEFFANSFQKIEDAQTLTAGLLKLNEQQYQGYLESYVSISADNNWINKNNDAITVFLSNLPQKQFREFFKSAVTLKLLTIDNITNIRLDLNESSGKHYQENADFIEKFIKPFDADRREIEALIEELARDVSPLASNDNPRNKKIIHLTNELKKITDGFFAGISTNHVETLDSAAAFKQSCIMLVEDAQDYFDGHDWIARFLLCLSHILIVTIPFIWAIADSRNCLLGKTDRLVAESIMTSATKLHQKLSDGYFSSVFPGVKPPSFFETFIKKLSDQRSPSLRMQPTQP